MLFKFEGFVIFDILVLILAMILGKLIHRLKFTLGTNLLTVSEVYLTLKSNITHSQGEGNECWILNGSEPINCCFEVKPCYERLMRFNQHRQDLTVTCILHTPQPEWHTHTHTHTHAYMFRASRGDHQRVLEFFTYFRGLCYSSGRAITGLSQSEDLRHLSVCREREISHREKKGRNPD